MLPTAQVESCACFRVEQGANSANYTIHVVEGALAGLCDGLAGFTSMLEPAVLVPKL